MTAEEVMKELKSYGNEGTKKVLMKHGAREPFFGVKVQDLKKIVKKTKKNHELSLALYKSGNSDAMYLAGLIADEKKISKQELNKWVEQAYWYMISEYAVPWVAAETAFGFDLALEWIEHKEERIASAGWATLASYASVNQDENLDIQKYDDILNRVGKELHSSKNRVRYTMNGFVIAVGSYIPALTQKAKEIAREIGKVEVDVGGTACKVPFAPDYIKKVEDKNRIGKKRKTARC